ncbi:UNVERIFIED_CONTAM: hypothetical protein Slati_2949600 [Sesamum latifolium]|uniref:Endonuclease/exonuclease/phosphatase domain-containing protein n=1 Tax=Sesamum latifolium TaxID=2727402 RepID=A0AAW2VES8_9LAMI
MLASQIEWDDCITVLPASSKGKEIVVYNPFTVLSLYDDDDCLDGGPKGSSPNKTHVAASNVMNIQSHLLHGWKWFVDPLGPGNRIWLAWDDTEIDVDILIVHMQCIHYRVHDLRSPSYSLVTVVFGLNDSVPRRELWAQLGLIMEDAGDDPWLVLGDFNTVLDLSGVCGSFGDISMAMGDFRNLLLETETRFHAYTECLFYLTQLY